MTPTGNLLLFWNKFLMGKPERLLERLIFTNHQLVPEVKYWFASCLGCWLVNFFHVFHDHHYRLMDFIDLVFLNNNYFLFLNCHTLASDNSTSSHVFWIFLLSGSVWCSKFLLYLSSSAARICRLSQVLFSGHGITDLNLGAECIQSFGIVDFHIH